VEEFNLSPLVAPAARGNAGVCGVWCVWGCVGVLGSVCVSLRLAPACVCATQSPVPVWWAGGVRVVAVVRKVVVACGASRRGCLPLSCAGVSSAPQQAEPRSSMRKRARRGARVHACAFFSSAQRTLRVRYACVRGCWNMKNMNATKR